MPEKQRAFLELLKDIKVSGCLITYKGIQNHKHIQDQFASMSVFASLTVIIEDLLAKDSNMQFLSY